MGILRRGAAEDTSRVAISVTQPLTPVAPKSRPISHGFDGDAPSVERQARAAEAVEQARRAMAVDVMGLDEWNAAKPAYEELWRRRTGELGGSWEDVEPAYRFAWEMLDVPQYRGRSWDDIEEDLRRGWSISYRELPWERASLAIHDAWEHERGTTPT